MTETSISSIKAIDYLINAASVFKNDSSKSHNIIQNHFMYEYLIRSKILNDRDKIKTTFLKMCQWCLLSWNNGMFSVYIEPEKPKTRSMKSLLNKKPNDLNKFQRKLVKKCLKNLNCNYLVVKCHICSKKSKLPLVKPNKIIEIDQNEELITDKAKKKKKKKKDLCAGLNPVIVAKVRPTNIKNQESEHVTQDRIKDSIHNNKNKFCKQNNQTSSSSAVSKHPLTIKKNKLRIEKLLRVGMNPVKQNPKKKSLLSSFLDSL